MFDANQPTAAKPADADRDTRGIPAAHARFENPLPVALRCPKCQMMGNFAPLVDGGANTFDARIGPSPEEETWAVSMRRCPTPTCRTLVFAVVAVGSGRVLASYPTSVMPFDAEGIPEAVKTSFEEALRCHANQCDRAAAMMIRRTLEVVAADRGATGKDLKERLEALHDEVILPPQLMEAATELRFFGNDAAHVYARAYSAVGEEQVADAIELAGVILQSVYQRKNLLERLRAHRLDAPGDGDTEGAAPEA